MIDSSAIPEAVRRHLLTTFGTLALSGPENEPVLGVHGHHRRRLALLAVLAAAGARGRSRDQLLLLFWPEATQTRARHSLDQLLYALRGSIDATLFTGVNPVRLNPNVVGSDVATFNAAIERGDYQVAAETYRGPFLDGFYLADSLEFERWVESERSRLAGSYAAALERLARGADAAGEHEAATRWWQALTDVDPLSSRHAARRIQSLVNAGDHPAALQFALRYESLVAQELGTTVDPVISALVNELRASARVGRRPASAPPVTEPGGKRAEQATIGDGAESERRDDPARAGPHARSTRMRRIRRAPAAYVAAVLLATSGTLAAFWRSRTSERALLEPIAERRGGASVVGRTRDGRSGATTLPPSQRGTTQNVAAHELYRRASEPAVLRSDSAARRALEQFRQAVALDPGYAAAYAGLALMHLRVSGIDSILSRREHLALAEEAAQKAVALDDSLAEAHASLSFVRGSDLDMRSAESEMRRAVMLDPTNARLREYLAQIHVTMEQPTLALAEARRALELDPLSPTAVAEVAHALLANDRCDEALEQLARLTSLEPPLLRAGSIAAQCYARKRMWPEAIAAAHRTTSSARGLSLLGHMLGRAGRTADAERVAATLIDRAQQKTGGAFDVAVVYAGLGDHDRAFAWLDRAVQERSVALQHHYELIRGLSSDPRFDRFRNRLGIPVR